MADLLNPNPNSTEGRLAVFLRRTAGRHMNWGTHDCGLWIADWMQFWRGIDDPAASIRGRYDSAESCLRLFGGTPYAVMTGRLVRAAGWRGARDPQVGAVGVVAVKTERGDAVVGAIRTAAGWAVLRDHGYTRLHPSLVRVLGAWEPDACLR